MGGVVGSDCGIGAKLSMCWAVVDKAQATLRLEYDVQDEKIRELEFLENGGDLLNFKFGHVLSGSVHSTPLTDQQPEQNLCSEGKGSVALTASPHRNSVESSGHLGVTIACEPNSADNFDSENETLQRDRKSIRLGRSNITPSEHSSQLDKSHNAQNSDNPPNFHAKKGQAYRRRNQSRINDDDPRSSSSDMASLGRHGCSMPAQHEIIAKTVASENQLEMELDGTHVMHSTTSRVTEFAGGKLNLPKEKLDEAQNPSLKVDEAPDIIGTAEPSIVVGRGSVDTLETEDIETSKVNRDDKCKPTDALIINSAVMVKSLDSVSSCTQTNVNVNGNENIDTFDSDLRTPLNVVDSNGAPMEDKRPFREFSVSRDDKMLSQDHVTNSMGTACIEEDHSSTSHHLVNGIKEDHAEVYKAKSSPQDDANGISSVDKHGDTEKISKKELGDCDNCVPEKDSSCHARPHVNLVSTEFTGDGIFGPSPVLDSQSCTENQSKSLDKAEEYRILEEAQMMQAKHKRIVELSLGPSPRERRNSCHWDLVLEEMAWLANDFAQERLWKMTVAAQFSRRVAFAYRIRLDEQNKLSEQKSVAHTLAKAVIDFWRSARLSVEDADSSQLEKCNHEALLVTQEMDQDKASPDGLLCSKKNLDHTVYGYAVRFLQFNRSPKSPVGVAEPMTTDVACDIDFTEVSWHDQFTEETLFYAVLPGAMEMYRKLVETSLAECERVGNNIQEEVVSSSHVAEAEYGYEDNNYEEDEGGNLYCQPQALVSGKPLRKKRESMISVASRSYDCGGTFRYGHFVGTGNGPTQLHAAGRRPTDNIYVDPVPSKRIRTASRQRVVDPFGGGLVGVTPVLCRDDTSSENTNSFQDNQSTMNGVFYVPRGSEVDSKMNFEKESTFDVAEMSAKPKRKKEIKHQKDLVRKRLDNQELEPNGNDKLSLLCQHAKQPNLATHSLDNSFDNSAPVSGSVASPVASQISNLSSQTKAINFIGCRDKGRKGKGLKVSIGQLSSGSPWAIVEDQALVVLVHDMGPNWELVSDALNNILLFKCILRNPRECKERHKFLMDKPSGDTAEESGSPQPYPSTLPGIPKGSARRLFRSLHAHVEEDNIKSRFEKIIHIEQKLRVRKRKGLKQILPSHGSHILSLSQVIPNNVKKGVLMPLDLCDTASSNEDPFYIGLQSAHAGWSTLPNQSSIPPMHSPSGLHSSLQATPTVGIGKNPVSTPSRYLVPNLGYLPMEEQQRLHQYNSMFPGRNVQTSNGASVLPGKNRSTQMARPGGQGILSLSMMESENVLASNVGGMPSNMNVHSGIASCHGKTLSRHHDSLHGVQPGQSSQHQRQMVLPEMEMQATQSNSLTSGLSNNLTMTPLQTYPTHHHPYVLDNHVVTPEQQAYIHICREMQMQQMLFHSQQHPATSSASMAHVQTPSQLTVSSPSQPLMSHVGPGAHQQQENTQGLVTHGAQSMPSGAVNRVAKKRQRQRHAQQYPQRHQQPPQQAPKRMKQIGKGDMSIHQNLSIDPSHLNGIESANSESQVSQDVSENGDPAFAFGA